MKTDKESSVCRWTHDFEDNWDSPCGRILMWDDEHPDYRHCPYCGKKIEYTVQCDQCKYFLDNHCEILNVFPTTKCEDFISKPRQAK